MSLRHSALRPFIAIASTVALIAALLITGGGRALADDSPTESPTPSAATSITGQLKTADDAAQADGTVVALDESGKPSGSDQLDQAGKFDITVEEGGDYILRFKPAGSSDVQYYNGALEKSDAKKIAVATGETANADDWKLAEVPSVGDDENSADTSDESNEGTESPEASNESKDEDKADDKNDAPKVQSQGVGAQALNGTINGTVAVSDGGPINPDSDLWVEASQDGNWRQTRVQTNGTYSLTGLDTSESVDLRLYDEEGIYSSQEHPNNPISFEGGTTLNGIDFFISERPSISGTVTAADGFPLGRDDLYVGAYKGNANNEVGTGYVQSDGTYKIKGGIETGSSYKLKFYDESGNSIFADQWYGGTNFGNATPVAVTELDPQVTGKNFTVQNGTSSKSISGTVNGGSVDSEADLVVQLCEDDWNCDNQVSVDKATGKYIFRGLVEDDEYYVQVMDYHQIYLNQWYDAADSFDEAELVPVGANGATGINFTLGESDRGTIAGTVNGGSVFEDHALEVEAVSTTDSDYTFGSVSVNSEGKYKIYGLETDTNYKLRIHDGSGYYSEQWYSGKSSFEFANQVELQSTNKNKTGVNFTLTKAPTISGKLTGPGGAPLNDDAYLRVRAYDASQPFDEDEYKASSGVDSSGNYELRSLEPGKSYKLLVDDENGIYAPQWYSLKTTFASANAVLLPAGATPGATVNFGMTLKGVPNAPTGVTASFANGVTTVSFTAGFDNGAVITGFTCSGAGSTGSAGGVPTGSAQNCVVPGNLARGVNYTFSVNAINSYGSGASASVALTIPKLTQNFKKPKTSMKRKKSLTLPAKTNQGITIKWTSLSKKICTVSKNKVKAKNKKGNCIVQGKAASDATYLAATSPKYKIKVK